MAKNKRKFKVAKEKDNQKKNLSEKTNEREKGDLVVGKNNKFTKFDWLFLLCLSVLTFVIYIPALKAGFYYDDNHTVLTQHLIRDIGFGELVANIFSMTPRSLLTLTYYFNFKMSYIDAWSYHLLSILIHIFNVGLVYGLVRKLLQVFKSGLTTLNNILLPFVVAVIFAIHPLMTEGVTYVSSRSDQLPAMMTFLAVWFFIKFIDNDRFKYLWIIFSILSFYLSLLSKQTGVMIVFVIIVLYLLLKREKEERIFTLENLKKIALYLIAGIVFILSMFGSLNVIGSATKVGELVDSTPLIHYIYSEIYGNLFYLKLLLYPIGQSIRHDLIILDSVFHPRVMLSLGIFLLIFYLVWKFYRNNNLFLFGFFFYILVLSPVASIVRLVEVIAEHRLYHPSFGFYLCVSIVLLQVIEYVLSKGQRVKGAELQRGTTANAGQEGAELQSGTTANAIATARQAGQEGAEEQSVTASDSEAVSGKFKIQNSKFKIVVPVVIFSLIFITLSTLTYKRNKVWLGEIPLWTDAFAKRDPEAMSTVIYNNVGLAYFRDGQFEEAIKYYMHGAVTSQLTSYHNLANLGTLYREKQEYERAIRFFDLAIRAKPDFAYAHFDQGVSFAQLGDLENAKRKFEDTLKYDQHYLGAHRNLGIIEQRAGNLDKALEYFELGLQYEPYEGKYYHDMALIYMEKREFDKAEENLQKAMEIMPNEASPQLNMGLVLLDQKRPEEALPYFEQAYRLEPTRYTDALFFMGNSFEMLGDIENAKKFYSLAIEKNAPKSEEAKTRIEGIAK